MGQMQRFKSYSAHKREKRKKGGKLPLAKGRKKAMAIVKSNSLVQFPLFVWDR